MPGRWGGAQLVPYNSMSQLGGLCLESLAVTEFGP